MGKARIQTVASLSIPLLMQWERDPLGESSTLFAAGKENLIRAGKSASEGCDSRRRQSTTFPTAGTVCSSARAAAVPVIPTMRSPFRFQKSSTGKKSACEVGTSVQRLGGGLSGAHTPESADNGRDPPGRFVHFGLGQEVAQAEA